MSALSCEDAAVVELMESFGLFDTNVTGLNQTGCHGSNRSTHSLESQGISSQQNDLLMLNFGRDMYAYVTPVIVLIGLIGNIISLRVFTSKVMRRLNSSYYLVCLSGSDIIVLLTYVTFGWLNKGLPRWPGQVRLPLLHFNGVCQCFLYLSYTARFVSAWLIVVFTIERYIGVCRPWLRKKLCTKGYAKKMIFAVFLTGALLCLYKPILSGVYEASEESVCTRNPEFHGLNFGLDSVYGILITAVPSIVIGALNIPILRKILVRDKLNKKIKLVFKENRIRLEFTVILLTISSCFICLNLPYFIIWCMQFHQSLYPRAPTIADRISGQLYITKTIFYINYCINFFLYCLTGAYYRREIRLICRYKQRKDKMAYAIPVQQENRSNTPSSQPTTKMTKYICTFM